MKQHSWIQALALVAVLALGVTASAQTGSGTVTGVASMDGEILAGALVMVSCSSNSAFEERVVADQQGAFSVPGVPLGGFSVLIFDQEDNLLATGQGTLEADGDTVAVELAPPS